MSVKNTTDYEAPRSYTLGGDDCTGGPGGVRSTCDGGPRQVKCEEGNNATFPCLPGMDEAS
jgi:hypothetical protein